MTRSFLILSIFSLLAACKAKVETRQWNLEQTMGSKSANPKDLVLLFIKWKLSDADSLHISDKGKFDEAVLQELRSQNLGDQAENNVPGEKDLVFVVSRDYQKAIAAIVSVAMTYKMEKQITIYKRDYQSYDKWTDKAVYPD